MASAAQKGKTYIFEEMPILPALAKMAIPTILSQLVTLVYNMADTWFIGQTNNPYMVAASSLVLTVYMISTALANLFGTGGGTLAVRLLGGGDEEEARKTVSVSLILALGVALAYSGLCLVFMNPLLRTLGASEHTIGYARQYLLFVVVLGGPFTILSVTMNSLLRNAGYSRESGFGMCFGGLLNMALDPLFMFVLLPDGYEVMGAAIATMLSNMATFTYFLFVYRRVSRVSILSIPRRFEKLRRQSYTAMFGVGVPAAMSIILYDLANMVLNRLSSGYGDQALAAMGIVLKVERLPLNIGIGICLGMVPLVAYNYASGNWDRMRAFFRGARTCGVAVSVACVVLYRCFAPVLVRLFIQDETTVAYGTSFLQARCYATPFMFLSFHMVHFMQSVGKGRVSFRLAAIRQLCLNIPIALLFNSLFGIMGIVWTQATADAVNVVSSYVIYHFVAKKLFSPLPKDEKESILS